MTLVIVISICLVVVSFLCSFLEAIYLTVTPSFVAVQVKEGKKAGKLWEHLKEDINRPISAILTLNTISQTAGSSLVGALAHDIYGNVAVTLVSGFLTLSILVFSEILPKVLGAIYWKKFATFAAYAIQFLIFLLYPVVRLTELVTNLFSEPEDSGMSREELISTAEMGAEEGTLHQKESTIIKNLLMLNNVFVSDIMTPRSVMFAIEGTITVEEVLEKYKPLRFSRIPVYSGNLDNIVGMTHRYKILEAMSNDHHDTKIESLLIPINTVPERMTVAAVIDLFIKRKEHLALAVDEYSIVTGLVSLEDAIETLLGVEIVDEFDQIADMRQYALEQWNIRKNQFRKT